MRRTTHTMTAIGCTAMLWLSAPLPTAMAAESPRIVISDLKLPANLGSRERRVLDDLNLVGVISESLTDSRSFRVQVRDNAGVQELIREDEIQRSPLGRSRNTNERSSINTGRRESTIGLDSPDYILQPTLQSFSIETRYEKQELIPGMYERIDKAQLKLYVRIMDMRGNVVFQEYAQASAKFPTQEATEEQKRIGKAPPIEPIRVAAGTVSQTVVDAIVARINPITVLDVQAGLFVVDRGFKSGFDEKSTFRVYAPSRAGTHPNTGAPQLTPGDYIGQAQVVVIHEDVSELKLVDGNNARVAIGSVVRINRKAAP